MANGRGKFFRREIFSLNNFRQTQGLQLFGTAGLFGLTGIGEWNEQAAALGLQDIAHGIVASLRNPNPALTDLILAARAARLTFSRRS